MMKKCNASEATRIIKSIGKKTKSHRWCYFPICFYSLTNCIEKNLENLEQTINIRLRKRMTFDSQQYSSGKKWHNKSISHVHKYKMEKEDYWNMDLDSLRWIALVEPKEIIEDENSKKLEVSYVQLFIRNESFLNPKDLALVLSSDKLDTPLNLFSRMELMKPPTHCNNVFFEQFNVVGVFNGERDFYFITNLK